MNTTRKRKSAPAVESAAPATAPKAKRATKPKATEPAAAAPRRTARKADAAPVPARKKPVAVKDGTKPARRAAPAAPVAVAPAAAPVAVAPAAAPKKTRAKKAAEPTIDVRVRDAVIARLDAMKAVDLKVIDVRGKTSVTDCIVIASGTSTRHVKSMGDEVVVTAKKFGMPPLGVEGEKDAEWMLVDLGDTVVHVMLPRTREFYGLERLWTLAEESRAASAV